MSWAHHGGRQRGETVQKGSLANLDSGNRNRNRTDTKRLEPMRASCERSRIEQHWREMYGRRHIEDPIEMMPLARLFDYHDRRPKKPIRLFEGR